MLIGIPGLRWTDITARNAPALWRLASRGSVGSLVVSAVHTRSCPADGWLTLNSGARATGTPAAPASHGLASPAPASERSPASPAPASAAGSAAPCPPLPLVVPATARPAAGSPQPARIPAMPRLVAANRPFHYNPDWGLLARAAGPGRCATAIGAGAALALAGPGGQVASYLPSARGLSRAMLNRCPLTVIDLGALPAGAGQGGAAARARAVEAADAEVGRISAGLPAGAILTVAGLADDSAPHLRAIIVTGPGYHAGLLSVASTRQPGMTLITDLTPTVLGWRGRPVPAAAVGSPLTRAARASLTGAVRGLIGQDTAAQVYRSTILVFFLVYGFGEGILFGLLRLILRGNTGERSRRRLAAYRVAGIFAAAVPAGTFLASLVPWWLLPHPALLLYSMALGWAVLIAAVALAGPWRRDPFGPPGAVAAVTVAVIGLDVMTGSRLQLGTPFGLSALEAGRFYGVGNNALGIYGASGILLAAWAAVAVGRGRLARNSIPASVTAGSAPAGPAPADFTAGSASAGRGPADFTAGASPAAAASDATHPGRGRAVAAAAAVALFTVVASGWPGFGAKAGGTIGHALHGGSGGILQRKVSANVGSLTTTIYSPIVPAVVIVAGLIIAFPGRFRLRALADAAATIPLLRPVLTAIWLVAVLGWIADDSGVTVAASAIPLALMLVIALVSGAAPGPGRAAAAGAGKAVGPGAAAGPAPGPAAGSAASRDAGTGAGAGNSPPPRR